MYKPFSWASGLKQAGSLLSGCVRETTSLNSLFTTCWGGWGANISTRRSFQFFTVWSIPEGSLTWAAVGEECQEIELHSVMKEFTDWFSVLLLCTLWVMSGQQSCTPGNWDRREIQLWWPAGRQSFSPRRFYTFDKWAASFLESSPFIHTVAHLRVQGLEGLNLLQSRVNENWVQIQLEPQSVRMFSGFYF